MRIIIFIALVYISNFCAAQTEDLPDYRSKRDFFSRISENDIRSEIASFALAGIDESVGKPQLKSIPISGYTPNSLSFAGDNIQITITLAPFNASKHKLAFYDIEKQYLVKIDYRGYFGDYYKVPKMIIQNISMVIDKDTVAIPVTAYNDLYNPILTFNEGGEQKSSNHVFVSGDGHRIYIYMLKQEAGGSYEVTWIIQDKKYLKRVVDFGFLK